MHIQTKPSVTAQFRRIFQDPVLAVALIVSVIFVALAILLPIVSMLGATASPEGVDRLQNFLQSPVYQSIIGNTLLLGVIVGGIGTLVGFLFAFVQVKLNVPFKRFMHLMALLPVISPPFAVATSVIVLFGRNGKITYDIFKTRYDIYGLDGLTIALSLSLFTVAYLNLKGMMEALDPALDEAALNMGASKWRAFRTVTIPMLAPGIASSFLLIFVESIADLGNPLILGGNFEVLATRIYVSVIGLDDRVGASVLSFVLLVPSLTVFIVQRYWIGRKSVVSVTGKPAGTPQLITNPVARWGLWGVVMAICLLILLVYGTIFHGAFVQVPGVRDDLFTNFTLSHFDYVINSAGREAMQDTTILSIVSTPIAGLIGMVVAFLVVRKEFLGRLALDFGVMLGIAVPGTIIGIGYILAFHVPITVTLPILGEIVLFPKLTGGQGLLGGAVAITLVYVIRSVPAALRTGTAALSQIDPAIEEASVSLGADSARTFRRITLPLIRPAFLASLIFAFARSMTTISAVVFLTTPQTKIMTAQILNEVENGRYGNAFAFCVILVAIVLIAIGILYLAVGSRTGAERRIEGGL